MIGLTVSHMAVIPKPDKDSKNIAAYRILTMHHTVVKIFVRSSWARREGSASTRTRQLKKWWLITWMNAAKLSSDIYDGFERGEETLGIGLDLEDTY